MNLLPRIALSTLLIPMSALVMSADIAIAQNSIEGRWLVVREGRFGSSRENWDIQIHNGQLFITSFREQVPGVPLPGDYRTPLSVEGATSNNEGLYLRIRENVSVVYEFQLAAVSSNRIEGVYRYVDTTLIDQGIVVGSTGTITEGGRVIMTRQAN